MSTLNLLYKKEYKINDSIKIMIPTVGEIVDNEDDYYSLITVLTAMPIDLMVPLDEAGIDYTQINDYELLRGFKISREWSSYSHFSPLWTKYFVEQNSLKCVADPFGGWGHHMVGVLAAGAAYIYNDLSHSTVEGVRKIAEFLRGDTEIYEGDAAEFVIPDRCDGVFMCPPYYNTEIYECGKFNSRQEYDTLMRKVIQNYLDSCANTLGIIIREDYEYLFDKLMETTGGWKKKEPVNKMLDHMTKEGKINEFLYTFVKDNNVTEKNAKLW